MKKKRISRNEEEKFKHKLYTKLFGTFGLFCINILNSLKFTQIFRVVQLLSHVQLPGFPVLQSLLKLMTIESVMPSNHLILYHPLLLLPSIFPIIRVFSRVNSSHQVAKVLKLQLQHESFQWIFRSDFLQDWLVWSPCCPRVGAPNSNAYLGPDWW